MGDYYRIEDGIPQGYSSAIKNAAGCKAGTLSISDSESTITANTGCKVAYRNYVDMVTKVDSVSQDLSDKILLMYEIHKEHDDEAGRNNAG